MVDSTRVAILYRVDDLDEHALDKLVFSEERELADDGVKIASAEVVDEEGEVTRVDLAMEGEDVWVGRDPGMELGFASLVVVGLHALDGILRSRLGVDGTIDDAEGPRTQDGLYPERAVVDGLTQQAVCKRRTGRHSGRGVGGYQPSPDFSALG